MARNPKEKAIDYLLTAYQIDHSFSCCKLRFMPETKLQKLVFLAEKSMIDERKKGFCFRFIKFILGPYSSELDSALKKLVEFGLLDDSNLGPTNQLKILLEDFRDVLNNNSAVIQKIERINEEYAKLSLGTLLKRIYSMPWGKGDKTINDLTRKTPMLWPMKPEKVILDFNIGNEELVDLLMNFDPKIISEHRQAVSDMREGRTKTYEQVFSKI